MKRMFILMMVMVMVLTACGSNDTADVKESKAAYNIASDNDADFAMEEVTEEMEVGAPTEFGSNNYTASKESSNDGVAVVNDQRKIIKSSNMEVETLEFDRTIATLEAKVAMYQGYVESSNVHGKSLYNKHVRRSASYTLRIPEKDFVKFLDDVMTLGNVLNKSNSGNDITSQYYDSQARLKTLEVQEERLLSILAKAEKIEDIITLERELSNVRYQIEGMAGNIRRWDNLVNYATLHIYVMEVYEETKEVVHPKTLGERITARFKDSLESIVNFFENTTVFFIGRLPFFVLILPIFLVVYWLIKKKRQRHLQTKVSNLENDEKE